MGAVSVVEERVKSPSFTACRASRQKAKGSLFLSSVAKGILRLCEKASQRGACLGECNAEMQRTALFDAWVQGSMSFFFACSTIDRWALSRAVPERSREPASANCITCARSM